MRRHTLVFCLFLWIGPISINAQQTGRFGGPPSANGWDSIYRMSDQPGERGSAGNRPNYSYADGKRVGCICMDDTRSKSLGVGACGGHGGVRYWLTLKPGRTDTVRVATDRHYDHPHPLSQEERDNLSSANAAKGKGRKATKSDTVVMVHRFPDQLPVGQGQKRWLWQIAAVGGTSVLGLFLGAAWQKRRHNHHAVDKSGTAPASDTPNAGTKQPSSRPIQAERSTDDLLP
jgi:hypothetical protein